MVNKRFLELAKRLGNKDLSKVEIPEQPPVVLPENVQRNFLMGEFGEDITKKIQSKYKGISALNESVYEDGVVKGSNPYFVCAVNEGLRPFGLRTATSYDLQKIIEDETLDLRGFYEECGLVLFSEDEPNEYLAQHLAKQIKKRQNLEFPIMVPLVGLDLRPDNGSNSGLAFKLRDDAEIIYAPQLANDGNKFSKTDSNGLPVFDEKGKYILYATNSGLRVLYRDGDLILGARDVVLTVSYSAGRVIVCGEATRK